MTVPTPQENRTPEDWKRQGDAAMEAGDFDGALEAYFEALSLEPEHPSARYNLALVHLERDEYLEAIC